MEYKKLDKTSVIKYLLEQTEIINFFENDDIYAEEIGDGNLNFVYIVRSCSHENKALIVKQAVPYLRCVGEEFPLSRERMTYEIRALSKFYQIFPSFVPKIYHSNEDMSLVVMEFLDKHIIMRKGLMQAKIYNNFAEHISTYMAATLFYTSSFCLNSKQKRELVGKFNGNTELCRLSENLVFSFAFMEHETNDNENIKDNNNALKLFADAEFKKKVLNLKYKFMNQSDALLHGDLHTGSIMINEDETYVIDPEFAFVGPFGFDVGALLANLVNNYIYHSIVTKDEGFKTWLLQNIENVLEKFSEKFLNFWKEYQDSALFVKDYLDDESLNAYKQEFVKNIIKESVGFAGVKMARRVYGVAGVEEIRDIQDSKQRTQAEEMALKISRKFVMKYENINNIKEIIKMVKNAG